MKLEKRRTHPAVAALALLLAAVAGTALLLSSNYPEHVREHRLYLSEQRPTLDFSFDELSEQWTEADLRAQFPGQGIKCYSKLPNRPGDKSCFADISGHNGVAAMGAAFYFVSDRLDSVSLNIPWWAHGRMRDAIEGRYGRAVAAQSRPVAGVRLMGWALPDGSALFHNRDRGYNPVQWGGVFWSSRRACLRTGCLSERVQERS
ncbi:hypothetical protein PEC18_12520 [Paucibacter sp. O1-1]|nr:hypothetical protein [Paucibacter sp. O1-1]MDA3826641.1 hypothetical protein [Paucibacter sp. O1-1]